MRPQNHDRPFGVAFLERPPARSSEPNPILKRGGGTADEGRVAPPSTAAAASARPTILVADNDPQYSRSLRQAIGEMGFASTLAEASVEAVQQLRGPGIAAVIATVRMPSLRGAAMLQELARWPATTPVLAVGDPGTGPQILGALQGRPAAFLAQPFPRQSLERELARLLGGRPDEARSHGAGPDLDLRAIAQSIYAGDAQIPAIAPIAADLQRLLRDPESGVDDVLKVVGSDPAVATGILRLANSSRYRPPSPIRTVRAACLRLGNQRVLALAQEEVLRDLFAVGTGPVQQVVTALWRHTRVKACAARALAERLGLGRPDELQVAAMMIDLGELAMLRVCAEQQTRAGAWKEAGFLSHVAAGIARDHERITVRLLQRWQLEPWIVALARTHHTVARIPGRRTEELSRAVLFAAWAGSCQAGFGWLPGQEAADPGPALRLLKMTQDCLEEVFADAASWADDD